jgi:oxalate decarboxylase/phosphoglucose isomerase-like protein (cupin superfamily)
MFDGQAPPPLEQDAVAAPNGSVPQTFTHRMLTQQPIEVAGGQVRITDSTNFPVSKTIAAALVEVEPGGLRELHWHRNQWTALTPPELVQAHLILHDATLAALSKRKPVIVR